MAQNDVDYSFNPASALAALRQLQKGAEDMEKGVAGAGQKVNASLESLVGQLIKVNNRAENSQRALVRRIVETNEAYGRTPIQKIIADRDNIIKRLGNEQKLVEQVTASYAKKIKVMEQEAAASKVVAAHLWDSGAQQAAAAAKSASGSGSSNGARTAFLGAKDLVEGRGTYAMVEFGKSIGALSGAGAVIAGIAASVVGLGVAGFEAAKSLSELGIQTRDIQLRTGLSAREVGQFGFAARVVGQDVSITERLMRGLTMAIEDSSAAGEKGRDRLKGFGVDLLGVKEGAIPTSQVLQQLSSGLNALPNQWERNKAAIDIFKRAGVEALPFLIDLNKNLGATAGLQFASEAELSKFREYKVQIEQIDTAWEHLKLRVKEPLAAVVMVSMQWARNHTGEEAQEQRHGSVVTTAGRRSDAFNDPFDIHPFDLSDTVKRQLDNMVVGVTNRVGDNAMAQYRTQGANVVGPTARSILLSQIDRGSLEAAQARESKLRQTYDESRADVTKSPSDISAAKAAYESQRERVKGMQKAETDLQGNMEALRKIPLTIADDMSKVGKLLPAEREYLEFSKRPGVTKPQKEQAASQLGPAFRNQQRQQIDEAIAAGRAQMSKEGALVLGIPTAEELARSGGKGGGAGLELLMKQNQSQDRVLAEELRADLAAQKQDRQSTAQRTESQARVSAILSGRTDLSAQMGGVEAEAAAKRTQANQEFQDAKGRIDAEYSYTVGHEQLFYNERKTMEADLQEIKSKNVLELQEIQARVDEQHAQEIRKQMDSVKKDAESLFTTLFTHPQNFGKQLGSTVRSAALHPVIEGLSEMTARSLHPLIYGADGKGGLAAATRFNGPLGDVHVSGGALDVHVVNQSVAAGDKAVAATGGDVTPKSSSNWLSTFGPESVAMYNNMPMAPGGPGGKGLVGGRGGGGLDLAAFPGIGGFGYGSTLASVARLAPMLQAMQVMGGGSIPRGSVSSNISYAGGDQNVDLGTSYTSGPGSSGGGAYGGGLVPGLVGTTFSDLAGGFGGESPAVGAGYRAGGNAASRFGLLRGIVGGKGGSPKFNLAALKGLGSNFGIDTGSGANVKSVGLYGDTIGDTGTSFGSVITSPGAAALMTSAGVPLAMAGLTGVNRGTGKGILESTAGGALTGAGIGTMILPGIGTAIGAGVGAAAGLVASGIEDLVGVKSDRTKAIEQVKSRYHVTISNSMADQIASIAKSKYGDNVSVAVSSPEVRNMLGLYAAGTGQAGKFPQSADMPHGGSLANQGGTLYQQATYQYGNPYTYQSNLPVLGGNAGGNLPNPGGNINMSFNVDGASTENFLNGGVFTPSAVGDKVNANWAAAGGRTSSSMMLQDPTGTVS